MKVRKNKNKLIHSILLYTYISNTLIDFSHLLKILLAGAILIQSSSTDKNKSRTILMMCIVNMMRTWLTQKIFVR